MTALGSDWSRAEAQIQRDNRLAWIVLAMKHGDTTAYVWTAEVSRSRLPGEGLARFARREMESEPSLADELAGRALAEAQVAITEAGVPPMQAERMVRRVRAGWRA